MGVVSNVMVSLNWDKVTWECDGVLVEKHFTLFAERDTVLPLVDCSGVAMVLDYKEYGRDSMVVFNADGSLRFKAKLPDFIDDGNFRSVKYSVLERFSMRLPKYIKNSFSGKLKYSDPKLICIASKNVAESEIKYSFDPSVYFYSCVVNEQTGECGKWSKYSF